MSDGMTGVALLDFSHRVLGEMGGLLGQLRHLTINAVEHPEDRAALQDLVDVTRQAHNTFKLIECYGAELLTAELLALLTATQAGNVHTDFETAPVLILAGEKLSEYVDYLKAGGQDLPLALLALVNNMRACHGASLLSEALIVSPHFSVPEVVAAESEDEQSVTAFFDVVADTRHRLMHELVGWFRATDSTGAKKLTKLFARLEAASPNAELTSLWSCAKAISVSLADGGLAPSAAVKLLFGQLERYVQKLHQQASLVPGVGFPSILFKNLLYYIALSESDNVIVADLKKQYRLLELLPPKSSLEIARAALGGPGARLSEAICNSLAKELGEVKFVLETTANLAVPDDTLIDAATQRLQQVSYTLLLLGLNHARLLNDRAIDRLESCNRDADSSGLLTVASDILQVDSALDEYLHGNGRPALFANDFTEEQGDVGGLTSVAVAGRLSTYQYNLIVDQCLNEAVRSLQSVQGQYLAALTDPQRRVPLVGAATVLRSIVSALQILPLPEIKPLLDGAADYLVVVAHGQTSLGDAEQVAFAELLVCCEFYMDSALQQQPAAADLLLHAEGALDALGKVLDEHDETVLLNPADLSLDGSIPELQLSQTAPVGIADSKAVIRQPAPVIAKNIDPDMLSVFINEALEELGSINRELVSWRMLGQEQGLAEVRRHYHTLKGSGRVAGAIALADFAATNEALVGRLLQNGVPADDSAHNLLEESSGVLPQLINQLSSASQALGSGPSSYLTESVEGIDDLVHRLQNTAIDRVQTPSSLLLDDELDQTTLISQVPQVRIVEDDDGLAEMDPGDLDQTRVLLPSEFDDSTRLSFGLSGDSTLLRVFYTECHSHLEVLTEMVKDASKSQAHRLPTTGMQRTLHTMRGSAQTAHAPSVVNLVLPLESATVDKLATGQQFDNTELGIVNDAVQTLVLLVDALSQGQNLPDNLQSMREQLTALAQSSIRNSDQGAQDSDLQDMFIDEATELLKTITLAAQSLSSKGLHKSQNHEEHLESLRADLHTLKGGAHVAQFVAIADLTHALEGAVERWSLTMPLTERRADLLQDVLDAITMNLEQARTGGSLGQFDWLISELDSAQDVRDTRLTIEQVSDQSPDNDDKTQQIINPLMDTLRVQPNASRTSAWPEGTLPGAPALNSAEQIRLDAAAVTRLSELSTEVSIQQARVHEYFHDLRGTLVDLDKTTDRLRFKLRELQRSSDLNLQSFISDDDSEHDATTRFDPKELERFTQMRDDSRQLTEILADYDAIRANLANRLRESEESLSLTARLGADIQQSLLRSRLIRFSQHAQRLNSVVRQTSTALGKQLEWELTGGERSIDRGIHKALAVPLEHLLRNAIVHGIEPPDVRVQLGKSATGRLSVTVAFDGDYLVVEVSDDGAGVDLNAVRNRVNDPAISDHELLQSLFRSGLTTVDEADQHAGRGVGLDAVARSIKGLDGTVSLSSKASTGTTVTLRIPQRVSVHQVVLIELDGMTCGLPVENVHTVVAAGAEENVEFDGHSYQLCQLSELLHLQNKHGSPIVDRSSPVVLVETAGRRYALRVREVLGYRELLASPVGRQISSLRCFSGGSILVDGRCVMMLDLNLLLSKDPPGAELSSAVIDEAVPTRSEVLIVDDSVTMRTFAERILAGLGYTSVFARDGVEALERLKTFEPLMILLDIEMPRMNGIDLLRQLRRQPALNDIPVVIVSSRSSAKHRQQANDLGVAGYVVKPYREQELIRLVERLTDPEYS